MKFLREADMPDPWQSVTFYGKGWDSIDRIEWSNMPIGPPAVIDRFLVLQRDHGPWWKRIWRGKWKRFEGKVFRG